MRIIFNFPSVVLSRTTFFMSLPWIISSLAPRVSYERLASLVCDCVQFSIFNSVGFLLGG